MDTISPQKRSWTMAQVKSEDTTPEKIVRSALHRMGFRFRLHKKDLPGKPDIVLPKFKTVIFVNGCFWHRHPGCKRATMPASNTEYWEKKFSKTIERDAKTKQLLENLGWQVFVVWECELKNMTLLQDKIKKFLSNSRTACAQK